MLFSKSKFFARAKYVGGLVINQPARVWRHSKFVIGGWIFPRYKRNAVIIPCSGGLGDNLMLTTVAREIKKRSPGTLIHIITHHPRVFDRNPDVDFVSRKPTGTFPWMRPFRVGYSLGFPWDNHFIDYLCKCVNINGNIDYRTYVYPDEEDNRVANAILSDFASAPVILSRNGGKKTCMKKIWPLGNWTELVRLLLRSFPVIDLGDSGDPLPISDPRYRSLLGQTSLHQSAALLAKAKALITVDSGLHHLAAAFATPAICILGGVIPPDAIAYPRTKVLFSRPECCDCWQIRKCDRDLECLSSISVAQVLSAFNELQFAARPGAGLELKHPNISQFQAPSLVDSVVSNNPTRLLFDP